MTLNTRKHSLRNDPLRLLLQTDLEMFLLNEKYKVKVKSTVIGVSDILY